MTNVALPNLSFFSRIKTRSPRSLVLKLMEGAGVQVNGSSPHDIEVHDERFYRRILEHGSLGLGESYMDEWWTCHGLDQFITKLLTANIDVNIIRTPALIFQVIKSKLLNMQDRTKSLRVAREHYDLDNNFYSKMLDKYMQYTCAYYEGVSTLDEAQQQKLEQLCRKLDLQKSDRVLELGCGFGGFAKYAAENYGCYVEGYNISKAQVQWAREWTKDLPVKIVEADYRTARGEFDKVISVGLCEHVGYKNYPTLMSVAHRCMKKSGLFALHCIGGNVARVTTDPWLEKYIFPGSVMPAMSQLANAYEGLFVVEDWHSFGPDYDKTLMHWHENFVAHWDELRSDRFDDQFFRMWEYYLLMCAGSFRARKNQNWEVVFSKGTKPAGHASRHLSSIITP